ncbi:MAG TPA: hypothetical protein VEX16_00060 [Methyloceanibacter sp.]|nr:hypothetical protein [Methyloceanibacter sp.]
MITRFALSAAALATILFAVPASAERFALPGTAVVDDKPVERSDPRDFWTDQGVFDNSADPLAATGGDPEIKALQEEFPETNWPKNTN